MGVGYCICNGIYKIMGNLTYKNRVIRMSDKTWEVLKLKRKKSEKSWNLFLLDLINKK